MKVTIIKFLRSSIMQANGTKFDTVKQIFYILRFGILQQNAILLPYMVIQNIIFSANSWMHFWLWEDTSWWKITSIRHTIFFHIYNVQGWYTVHGHKYSSPVIFYYIQSNLPYRSPQINGHLCLTVTLRPAQLILLYNLTLFNGHLSNAANGHLFHAWIVRSSSNNGHFGHLITWHNVYDRLRDTITFKIINNCWREIQLIELVI